MGTISANGEDEIGKMIAQAMERVGNEGVITVEEAKSLATELDVVEGMQFDRGYLSPYFITDQDKMHALLENCYILLCDRKLDNLKDIMKPLELSFYISRISLRVQRIIFLESIKFFIPIFLALVFN